MRGRFLLALALIGLAARAAGAAHELTQAVGVRGRAGRTQRFGAHFLVSASAGLGANVDWTTGTFSQTTLDFSIDGTLSAGLMF